MIEPSKFTCVPLEKGESLKKVTEYKDDFGNYSYIGKLRTMRTQNDGLRDDVFDCLNKVSKGAITVFTELKLNMDYDTNLSYYPTKELNNSQKVMFRRYILELKKVGLVKKMITMHKLRPVKQGTYMIDPERFKCKNYSDNHEIWMALK